MIDKRGDKKSKKKTSVDKLLLLSVSKKIHRESIRADWNIDNSEKSNFRKHESELRVVNPIRRPHSDKPYGAGQKKEEKRSVERGARILNQHKHPLRKQEQSNEQLRYGSPVDIRKHIFCLEQNRKHGNYPEEKHEISELYLLGESKQKMNGENAKKKRK